MGFIYILFYSKLFNLEIVIKIRKRLNFAVIIIRLSLSEAPKTRYKGCRA